MFTLAQYVFGVGRQQQEPQSNNQNPQEKEEKEKKNRSCYENDTKNSNCLFTDIENDWILIDVSDDDDNHHHPSSNLNCARNSKKRLANSDNNHLGNNNGNNQNGKKSFQNENNRQKRSSNNNSNKKNEAWLVDPPECFKTSKKHDKSSSGASSLDVVKTSIIENLLIEHPSMSVFDNLFVMKPPQPSPVICNKKIPSNIPITLLDKTEQKKLILIKKLQQNNNKENNRPTTLAKKTNSNNNKTNNGNRNGEISNPFTGVSSSLANTNLNGNKKNVLNALIVKDKISRKNQITKKQHQKQNKVQHQRQGPIIRKKKMFQHINGIYNNRNRC